MSLDPNSLMAYVLGITGADDGRHHVEIGHQRQGNMLLLRLLTYIFIPTRESHVVSHQSLGDEGRPDDPWDFGATCQYPVLKYGDLDPDSQRVTCTPLWLGGL